MKPIHKLALAALSAALLNLATSHGAIVVPGADGSDGVLNITNNTVIDLSQAVTGNWDASNTNNAGKGIYDPNKWAVVFKYSSVTVATGMTLTFKNHASRAPVVWLVSGNVTIDGKVILDGEQGRTGPSLAEPGPGGFRGGSGAYGQSGASPGFGVGGGPVSIYAQAPSGGGSYGSIGTGGVVPYGNPSVVPLIGGAGGGAAGSGGGGAGGGAILIAVVNDLAVNGEIRANGGAGLSGVYDRGDSNWPNAGGSGGGIRLVSSRLLGGTGVVTAIGNGPRLGGVGRIRIERAINANTITVAPEPSVVDTLEGAPALLWPPTAAPEVKIVSIGGRSVSTDPHAEFGTTGADTVLPLTNSTQVVIETTNVESASQVIVRGTPRSNGNFTQVNATTNAVISTTPLVIRWTATLPVNVGYSAVQVKVVRP